MIDENSGIFREMQWSVIIAISVISVSLVVAYICFNILASSAQASLQDWKLGGAFAGFVFTAGLLSSIIIQFYNRMATDETEKYRMIADELRLKLLKGTEAPAGYTVDVDEKFKVIFARPGTWSPRHGILYQYIDKTKTEFATNFNVVYMSHDDIALDFAQRHLDPFDPNSIDLAKLYKIGLDEVREMVSTIHGDEKSLTSEWMSIDGNRSQKYIHTYTIPTTKDNPPCEMCQIGIFIYVARLKGLFIFTFSDLKSEFLNSSEIFNTVIASIRFL